MKNLRRIYDSHAYDTEVPVGSYWDATLPAAPAYPALDGDRRVGVAIIGAGYTGLSAALHLARDHGEAPLVIDAAQPGWGASGRNAGFCGFGGAKLGDSAIIRRFGEDDLRAFYSAQKEAVALVRDLTSPGGIAAEAQEDGEYCLAHSPRAARALPEMAAGLSRYAGVHCPVLSAEEMRQEGLHGDGFHGGLMLPHGFGLNPAKYVTGLARLSQQAGAVIRGCTPALSVQEQSGGTYLIETPSGRIQADRLIVASNGYSSDNLPDWLSGRYLPVVSHIMVTRPLTEVEKQAQGWTTRRIAFDTRNLLHYFRLLPDNRVLFGMRGSSNITPGSMLQMRRRIRCDFEAMFPALADAETAYHWSGLVCVTRGLTPYAGQIADWQRAWTGFGYHGGGVAMATYTGRLLAGVAAGMPCRAPMPKLMQNKPANFPIPKYRRHYLPLAYTCYGFMDLL
ncbi:NAD(P)/FAD-dependent oxidoreductase [Leisingera daeponensis]|uniref:NAD(P)/FAD-dependent oxidoreductase n=1 Tax=Leisingera daeponensis TaxID=405746 RepID=UPI001C942104|nr:FAD-binding oxidoreductase [Leisingera daeponensis]MBY6057842.1 FAD-binding oxidoreductase [Leisingera daeponensis]